MQLVRCCNVWELIASSTLPAALLRRSDEQKVGRRKCLSDDRIFNVTLRVATWLLKAARRQK